MTKKSQPHHVAGAIRPQHAKELSPKPVPGRSVTAAPYAARPSSAKAAKETKK
jgi:hypothetical protein